MALNAAIPAAKTKSAQNAYAITLAVRRCPRGIRMVKIILTPFAGQPSSVAVGLRI
jgi:hypothetical protein